MTSIGLSQRKLWPFNPARVGREIDLIFLVGEGLQIPMQRLCIDILCLSASSIITKDPFEVIPVESSRQWAHHEC